MSGANLTPEQPEANDLLIGHEAAERALLESYRSGRGPHAWIIDGVQGSGKATLAYRFARFVLAYPDPAHRDVQQASSLGVPAGSPVARQIAARAHPNLIVLERPRVEAGKLTGRAIPVESVRRVGRFLATTAAGGSWRIVVVDAADDLNRESANALLKMLEEPPTKSLFLLVSNLPGRLLPTIRSRCRRLSLKPLDQEAISRVLETAAVADNAAREVASGLAGGSVGRALQVASEEGQETAKSVLEILGKLPRVDDASIRALADRTGGRAGEGRYRLAGALLLDWIADRVRQSARDGRGPAQLAPWTEVWEKVSRALVETEIYNLDRSQTLLMAFRSVSAAALQDAAHA